METNLKRRHMETKKSRKADLRNKSFLFLQIGMVAALTIVLAAFQWSTHDKMNLISLGTIIEADYDPELIPITRTEIERPKPQPQTVAQTFELVEDVVEVPDVEIQSTEGSEQAAVTIIPMVDEKPVADDTEEFIIVEEMPVFPGGDKALMETIYKNIVYPELAKEHGIDGKVYVGFIVTRTGKVDKVKIVRGVDPVLDKEAMRAISMLPDWIPGKQRGKAVNVAFTVPISFKLN
jgi:protein TonB